MRAAVVSLALVVSSCAFGAGIDPAAESSTTLPATTVTSAAPTTTTTQDASLRAAAMAAAGAFLDVLAAGDWEAAATLVDDPPGDFTDLLASWSDSIALTSAAYTVTGGEAADGTAAVEAAATLTPYGFPAWHFDLVVDLVARDGEWRVVWDPSLLSPGLEDGDTLEVRTVWPRRASLLARDGTPLAITAPAWIIGVVPERIDDLGELTTTLEDVAGVTPQKVQTELAKPGVQPNWFVPVGTITASDGDAVAELQATPGVVLRETTERVRPLGDLAGRLVGRFGPITADLLVVLGAPYGPPDEVGTSGLEAAFEGQLAGSPAMTLVRVNRYGRDVETLLQTAGEAPQDVRTSIDVTVQAAAERALDGVTKPAAVVIVDTETSEVLAAVSLPAGGFDRALLGLYPPGSTFKIVTAAALLTNGMSPDDLVGCPGEVTLGGLHIPNAGGRNLGTVSLTTAFAQSCNTTFTSLAVQRLSPDLMAEMATTFGIGTPPALGVLAATSQYPYPADTAELAASAMGQGRVLLTPLQQATIAAAVSSGGWLPPTLIAGDPRPERTVMEPDVRTDLAAMMLAVVTEGGAGKAKVPGEVVRGKTGSAEFNDQGDTHAWFVGYWDHLAFAIVVESGGSGGQTSAPIAAAIIRDLAGA